MSSFIMHHPPDSIQNENIQLWYKLIKNIIYLEQGLYLLCHLASAGEIQSELVSVSGNYSLSGNVDTWIVHGPTGSMYEGDLVRNSWTFLGFPGEVNMVNLSGDNLWKIIIITQHNLIRIWYLINLNAVIWPGQYSTCQGIHQQSRKSFNVIFHYMCMFVNNLINAGHIPLITHVPWSFVCISVIYYYGKIIKYWTCQGWK